MSTTSNIAIKVDNVSKTFKLPHEKQTSIKSAALNFFKKKTYEKQEALRNINFEIKRGEFFGIVGRNGSGKSTLLKCMAGVYTPNKGKIHINGSLVPFIELGVGFNPELSGRDNIFLNGALLGFSRSHMLSLYDEIVEFAELEKFMDQKLKNYSSGMQVRLAFSIAIQAKGDILLLDEVLAVGDSSFQKKCFDYFASLKRTDQTVVLVTHDMSAIEKYCNRAAFIKDGEVAKIGSPEEVAYEYTKQNTDSYSKNEKIKQEKKNDKLHNQRNISLELINDKNQKINQVAYGDELSLIIEWNNHNIKNIGVALIKDTGEYVFGANTVLDRVEITGKTLKYKIELSIGPGKYLFKVGFFGKNDTEKIDFVDEGPSFEILPEKNADWGGIIKLKHSWSEEI